MLAKCHRTLLTAAENSISDLGLCMTDFAILEALLHKGSLTIGEIQRKVLLASGSMTAAVDRLEKRRLVVRKATAEDRRARVIELTGSGKRLAEKAFGEHAADLDRLFSVLDEQEIQDLYASLKKLGIAAAESGASTRSKSSERK